MALSAKMIDAKEAKVAYEKIETRCSIETRLALSKPPECPDYLSPIAREEWERMTKLYFELNDAKILSTLDYGALAMYCEAWSQWRDNQKIYKKLSRKKTRTSEENNILDKAIRIMNRQCEITCKLASQLCLTPMGRAKMGLLLYKPIKDEEEQALEDLGL